MSVKKRSRFWRIFWISGAVLFAALVIWLCWLYGWLSDYEAAQPKHVAKQAFDAVFADFDAADYVNDCSLPEEHQFAKEHIISELKAVTDGKDLVYRQVSNVEGDELKYVVSAGEGGAKFAAFYIEEDTESENGGYKIGKYELYSSIFVGDLESHSVVIEVPEGFTVKVNGDALSEKYILEKDIPTESCSHMPEGVRGIYYIQYGIGGFLEEPEITVTSSKGESCEVILEDDIYRVEPVYDTALKADHSEMILEAAEIYAKYSQYDWRVSAVGFSQVAPYFDPDSVLYEQIKTVDNNFVIEYDKYEFTDMTATEFYRYDDNVFSCRVQYTQKLYKGSQVYQDYIDQTLYLRNVDGKYLIYDMAVN